jgi:small subunit ribosomal protein S21
MDNKESRKPAWKKDVPKPHREPRIGPLEVLVKDNDVVQALKILKSKMSKEGILTELKLRRFAEKPSEKKRRKHREALKKMRKSRGRKSRYNQIRKKKDD